MVPEVIPLLVNDEKGRQLEAIYGSRLRIVKGAKAEEELSRASGLTVQSSLMTTATRTDRFKDTGHWYVYSADLEKISRFAELEAVLPWRYRQSSSYIRLRQHPTPHALPGTLLSSWLDSSVSERLKVSLMKRFGGRCQACGSLNLNKNGRQMAPELLVTWEHAPHLNQSRKMGMRIMKGIAGVCGTCYASANLSSLRHTLRDGEHGDRSDDNPAQLTGAVRAYVETACESVLAGPSVDSAKAHTAGSVDYGKAWHHPLLWLATHNRWPLVTQADVDRIQRWLTSIIANARQLDDYTWFIDASWLYDHGVVSKGVELPLHHRQKSRVRQPRPGILCLG